MRPRGLGLRGAPAAPAALAALGVAQRDAVPFGNHEYPPGLVPGTVTSRRNKAEEAEMPRKAGDRYVCEKCGAKLVYEKPCPCPEGMPHSEICCGQQMKLVQGQAAGKARKE